MLKLGLIFLLCTLCIQAAPSNLTAKDPKQKIISCWDPSTGTQLSCPSQTSFCQTDLTTGIGSCQSSCTSGTSLLCCNSGSNCNQIVTSCYDLASKTFNKCDPSGASKFCQISLPGPFSNPVTQFATASGTCQSTCTPSYTNSATLTFCCFAQDNCNYFPATGK
jgi:hypothetical protein